MIWFISCLALAAIVLYVIHSTTRYRSKHNGGPRRAR